MRFGSITITDIAESRERGNFPREMVRVGPKYAMKMRTEMRFRKKLGRWWWLLKTNRNAKSAF